MNGALDYPRLEHAMQAHQRTVYLEDLRVVVNARSVWLLRDFAKRYAPTLGRLSILIQTKTDEQLGLLIEDLERALNGRSDNQLATQLCAPWLLPRDRLKL